MNFVAFINKAILPLVRTITDNFVTDRASAEAITVGLNTIREICARCPYAVDEDLLSDLVGYKSYRNKNVVAAARSLIRLYRRVNPSLLPKREVGRPTEAVKEALSVDNADTDALAASNGPARVFGKKCVATSIVGAEVLIEAVTSDTGDGERPRKRRRVERNLERVLESADDVGDEGGTRREGLGPNTEIGENSISKCPSDDDADSISTVEEEGGRDVEAGGDEDLEERKGATNKASNAEENKLVRTKPAKNVALEEILATRVLTDEDFEAIRKRQAEKQTLFAAAGGRKRKRGEEVVIEEELFGGYADDSDDADSDKEVNPEEVHGLVSMRNITKLVKRPHSTKADRMDTVAEGREGRKKYGFQLVNDKKWFLVMNK
ncbi:hypothetical protein EGR_03226 [Echinococcus granulosus]|uniref:Protein SDA1 n=1 Tax=Echinococcus granulosus TaxID=6210 RepID=W6ULN6_ECHGR|nr:hypothetical protein EGR_03226 [Echinococcus granulosus]EUB61953.1 hypothetical protein EGR_03226 [Echinococcus granulosus]